MFSAEAGIITDPPEVTIKTNRTHCEHCKEPLAPDIVHKCAGNEKHHPSPPWPRDEQPQTWMHDSDNVAKEPR